MARKPPAERFEDRVERAITDALADKMEVGDRIKLLAVATRFAAIKNKIGGIDDAAGFDDDA